MALGVSPETVATAPVGLYSEVADGDADGDTAGAGEGDTDGDTDGEADADGDTDGGGTYPSLTKIRTVRSGVTDAPARGEVYATVPGACGERTSRETTSACTPELSIAASAAPGDSPVTSGTGTAAPRTTEGSAEANGSGATPASAWRIVAAQIIAGRSPPKTCRQ